MPTVDGWTMMAPVQAYFPNDIGLYDVVGNVAEMTVEKGKACGGSWNHPPEESTIRSINEYAGPDSRIGFRPFMEVIEE
jgi:formylglycine-generating enzyme required for sulfatase activity